MVQEFERPFDKKSEYIKLHPFTKKGNIPAIFPNKKKIHMAPPFLNLNM